MAVCETWRSITHLVAIRIQGEATSIFTSNFCFLMPEGEIFNDFFLWKSFILGEELKSNLNLVPKSLLFTTWRQAFWHFSIIFLLLSAEAKTEIASQFGLGHTHPLSVSVDCLACGQQKPLNVLLNVLEPSFFTCFQLLATRFSSCRGFWAMPVSYAFSLCTWRHNTFWEGLLFSSN